MVKQFSFTQYITVDEYKMDGLGTGFIPLDPDDKRINGVVPLWLMEQITIYSWVHFFF